MKSEEELMKDEFENIPKVSELYIRHLSDISDKVEDILKERG